MALTEHQLTHAASNIDPDEWLDDARAAVQEALEEDGFEGDSRDEFPDEILAPILHEMCGVTEPHKSAGECLRDLQRIVVRMRHRRPRSGHPDEASSPETLDVVGWKRHRERMDRIAGGRKALSEETKRLLSAAGGPRFTIESERWGGIKEGGEG